MSAEQQAAVLGSKLDDAQQRVTQAEERTAKAEERAHAAQREHQRLERQIQAQQAALDSAARELDASKQALKECQGRERKAADEAAELRGQLKSSMEIQTRGTTSKNSK